MHFIAVLAGLVLYFLLPPHSAAAHEPVVVAEVEDSALGPLRIRLDGAAAAPYRAFVLADPPRLVLDLAGAHLEGMGALRAPRIAAVEAGTLDVDWARMVVALDRPMVLDAVVPRGAMLTLVLTPASEAELAAAAALAPRQAARLPDVPYVAPTTPGKLRIVVDPGHGGVDPGARRAGVVEKDFTLTLAERLEARLEETGRYDVVLTRTTDRFVLLDERVALGRAAEAELFLSIHANTVEVGQAEGATVHVPSPTASDPESAALAVFENRSDMVAGMERPSAGDDVALALNAMLRPVTHARARHAAEEIVRAFREAGLVLHRKPLKAADFRVLRAPDMPSVLIEMGFLSNPQERARMVDPDWQAQVTDALVDGLDAWIAADRVFLTLMKE